jgi:hypothetical protein
MNPRRDLTIFLGALGMIALFFLVSSFFAHEKQIETTITEPYRARLTGEQVCLTKKVDGISPTLECTLGMKTDEGEYFALTFDVSSTERPDISNGERFSASGIVTPIERLNTDEWQKYDLKGIFSVTDSFTLEDDSEVGTEIDEREPVDVSEKPVATQQCYVGGCSSQICSDQRDMASDCMYRSEYMCYKDAVCERQASGQCGWTDSDSLRACLNAPIE